MTRQVCVCSTIFCVQTFSDLPCLFLCFQTDSEIWELMEKSEKHFIDLLAKNLPMYVYNRNMSNGLGEHTDSPDGRRSRKSK